MIGAIVAIILVMAATCAVLVWWFHDVMLHTIEGIAQVMGTLVHDVLNPATGDASAERPVQVQEDEQNNMYTPTWGDWPDDAA